VGESRGERFEHVESVSQGLRSRGGREGGRERGGGARERGEEGERETIIS
jgi:hypothetical protein